MAFQYSAEVFPTIQREQGMAWAVCINNTFGKLTAIAVKWLDWLLTAARSWYSQSHLPRDGACNDSGRSLYVSNQEPPIRTVQLANKDEVGFYAGLNLIAWFLVFCFVRETKQLTLEELDRKLRKYCFKATHANNPYRGVLRPDEEVHHPRVDGDDALLLQAPLPQAKDPEATDDHRERRQGHRRRWGVIESKS